MQIKTTVKGGLAALSAAALLGIGLPVRANALEWTRAQPLDFFRAKGLVPPGYFSQAQRQQPATVALSKSGQGLGAQQPTASKAAKKGTRHGHSTKKTP